MIIKKDCKLVELLKVFKKDCATPNCSTVVSRILFIKNKGIKFVFNENIESVYFVEPSVDFGLKVSGSLPVSAILSELENGAESVELQVVDSSKLSIANKYIFDGERTSDDDAPNFPEKEMTISAEEVQNLEKDFQYTIGNYFENPKTTETIAVAVHEGSVYKLLAGCSAYKIGKFNATIDETAFSRSYGHDTHIWLLPKKLFDLSIGLGLSFYFEDDIVIAFNDKVKIRFTNDDMGTNIFKRNLQYFGRGVPEKNFQLKFLRQTGIEKIANDMFDIEEDKNACVSFAPQGTKVEIENLKYNVNIKDAPTFNFSTNLMVMKFLIEEDFPDDALIGELEEDAPYIVKVKDEAIFVPKTNYID